jgi:hypothetical protein
MADPTALGLAIKRLGYAMALGSSQIELLVAALDVAFISLSQEEQVAWMRDGFPGESEDRSVERAAHMVATIQARAASPKDEQ